MKDLRNRVLAGCLAVSTALLVMAATAAPASAFDTHDGPDPDSSTPVSTTSTSSDTGSTAVGQENNCSVVSSPSYLGLSCGGGDGYTTESIKAKLAGDPLPDCWHEKLTAQELASMGLENSDDSTFYWVKCLKGINKKTLEIAPGGVHFTIGLAAIKNGEKVIHLHGHQIDLVDFYSTDDQIPYPVAAVSPMAHPRVGSWVSFFDGAPDNLSFTGNTAHHVVTVQAGGVTLRATEVSLDVEPLGKGKAPKVTCASGGVRAERSQTGTDHSKGCWYRYLSSSADQTDNSYQVNATSHWNVEVSDGTGGFTPFNSFTKSMITTIPVTEIEALVVP